MFNPKRLHPIIILLELLTVIRQVIIPIALYLIVFSMRDGKDQMIQIEGAVDWITQYGPMIAIGVVLIFTLGASIIKWVRYTYRVEDMELRIEYGLFIKRNGIFHLSGFKASIFPKGFSTDRLGL
ncbi:hypothetical protein ACI2OX_18550 [Bacillus sp. N9]